MLLKQCCQKQKERKRIERKKRKNEKENIIITECMI